MTNTDELLFNPFAPGFFENPYEQYKLLRDEDPVQNHPLGFWFVSRYEDVSTLLRAGLSVEIENLAESPLDFSAAGEDAGALNRSMLDRDPPDHTRLRSLVTKVFTRRAIAALEPKIVGLVDAALDRMAEKGTCDLVEELAFPLPFAVISEMLGMPPTDHSRDPRAQQNPGPLLGDRRRRGNGPRDRGGGRGADGPSPAR